MASLEFMVGGLVAWCWLNALAMSPPALSDTVVTAPERLVAMICGIDTPSLQNTVMRDRTA